MPTQMSDMQHMNIIYAHTLPALMPSSKCTLISFTMLKQNHYSFVDFHGCSIPYFSKATVAVSLT